MSEWKRISTAPEDGTKVQIKRVYHRSVIAEGVGYFGAITIDYAPEDGGPRTIQGWTRDGVHYFPDPTHWKPVAPPGAPVQPKEPTK